MSNKTSEKKSSPAEKNKGVRITIKNTSEGSVKERPRIHTLDELRGFAVFCMIFFHAFYTIGFVFGQKWGVTLVDFFYPAEPYFAGLFIIISGIASNLSHSNLERGVKLALISLTVSIVSLMVLGQKGMIQFGILHFLSAAMIFACSSFFLTDGLFSASSDIVLSSLFFDLLTEFCPDAGSLDVRAIVGFTV